MEIKAPLRKEQLINKLSPVYFLYGHETILLDESLQLLKEVSIKMNYKSSNTLFIEKEQDWQQLPTHMVMQSLFSEKTLLLCYIKVKSSVYKTNHPLIQYLISPPANKLLILYWPEYNYYSQKNLSWNILFKKNNIIAVAGYSLDNKAQQNWVQQHAQRLNLKLTMPAILLLLHKTENNLFATKQALEKLTLAIPQPTLINEQLITTILTQEQLFPIYALTKAAINGKIKRSLLILTQLKNEAIEPNYLLWHISQAMRLLAKLSFLKTKKKSTEALYITSKIYGPEKQAYNKLINSKSMHYWHQGLILTHQADKIIKGEKIGNIWNYLQQLLLYIGGPISLKKKIITSSQVKE